MVDVIFRAHETGRTVNPCVRVVGNTRAIAVDGPGLELSTVEQVPLARMLATYWYARTRGDRSGRWAQAASRTLDFDALDAIATIAFYTPRGPLAVAANAHRAFGVPWIADLQDPIDEGASSVARSAVIAWMRRTLRTASRVVQVSPEWATESSQLLNRPVDVLRHAVTNPSPLAQSRRAQTIPRTFAMLYAGSLNFQFQSATALLRAIDIVNGEQALVGHRRVLLRVASTRDTFDCLRSLAVPEQADSLEYAGWLSQEELGESIQAADALALIPWSGDDRQVVPSKLYEYLGYRKPILIAGPDSGGLRGFLREVQHPNVVAERTEDIAAVIRAMMRGDNTRALTLDECASPPLSERDVQQQYVAWVDDLAESSASRPMQSCAE